MTPMIDFGAVACAKAVSVVGMSSFAEESG
jgi:hypothetical protein